MDRTDARTTFQTFAPWSPRTHVPADAAMVYGIDPTLPERMRSWRERGYDVQVMTGVSWGQYQDYLYGRFDGKNHEDEAQTDRDGNRVAFSLTTNSGNKVRERICSILKEDWTKLGIQVNYRPVEFTTLVEKLNQTFDWDVVMIGFTASPEPHLRANLLLSSGNLHLWNPAQETPASPWEAEIDALVDRATRTLDEAERVAHYRRVQEILHEQLPMLQMVHERRFVAFDRRLDGFVRTVWGQQRPELVRFTE